MANSKSAEVTYLNVFVGRQGSPEACKYSMCYHSLFKCCSFNYNICFS